MAPTVDLTHLDLADRRTLIFALAHLVNAGGTVDIIVGTQVPTDTPDLAWVMHLLERAGVRVVLRGDPYALKAWRTAIDDARRPRDPQPLRIVE